MAYKTRSLNDLGASVRGMFRQYLPGTDATLRQNFVAVCAKVLALLSREYELRLAWIYRQLFVSTADDMAILRMHGADYRIYQRPAAAASGLISGLGQAGVTYPAGIRFLSGGATFVTTAAFTAGAGGAYTASVRAESAGAITNRDAGAVMTLADPSLYPSLQQTAQVASLGLGGGADIEDVESLRRRILARKAEPPQGGALADYERFALEVPGVLNAWAYQFTNGVGSIAIYFLFAGRENNIPSAADVAAVQANIDAKRLIRVDDAVVVAPIPSPVAITIDDLSSDTEEVRAAIAANLNAMFVERTRPGVSSDPFVLSRSWISEAISTAVGEDRHTLLQPASDLVFTDGRIPVLGLITYA
jgi:uncharacterized phage protein gp47/JayE